MIPIFIPDEMRLGDVMFIEFTQSVKYRGFDPRSDQTKDYKIA